MKESCEKAVAIALCCVMSFGVVSAVTMESVSAAPFHQGDSRTNHDRDLERKNAQREKELKKLRERQKKEEQLREKKRRDEKKRHEKERRERARKSFQKGHSQGEVNTAAIVGAVVGAVIAKNT